MLLTNFYTLKESEQQDGTNVWKVSIELNPEHPIYEGHFPEQPVVPGVCLMQIVKESIEYIRKESLQYTQVSTCKFLSAIDPARTPVLLFTLTMKKEDACTLKLLAEGTANEQGFIKLKAILRAKSATP